MSNGALDLSGRLGVEAVRDLKGCCVDSILAWRPHLIGEKTRCLFCDNPMKSIRPGDFSFSDFGFFPNKDREGPEQSFSALWFSCKRFENPEKVKEWCEERDIPLKSIEQPDDMVYRVKLGDVEPGTAKALWAAQGVVATIGVSKVAAADMVEGGMVNPTQGTPAPQRVVPAKPIAGTTEESDGHVHTFKTQPDARTNGRMLKGRTDVAGEHFHQIELSLTADGTVDGRTMVSQDIVGGHAHRHRIVFPEREVAEVAAKSDSYSELLGAFNTRLDGLFRR